MKRLDRKNEIKNAWSETIHLFMEIERDAFDKSVFNVVCFESLFQRLEKTISDRNEKDVESIHSTIP